MSKSIYIVFLIILTLQSCASHKRGVTEEGAKEYIKKYISKNDTTNYSGNLISQRKALRLAKINIYKTYGFWHIYVHEKPYKKYYIGNYLYLGGSIKEHRKGGVFWIVIDRRNGEVKSMLHDK